MSRARRNATALIALAAASSALAACGGDDEQQASTTPATTAEGDGSTQAEPAGEQGGGEGAGPSDEQQVEAAVEALLTDPDNERVCNEVLGENLLETAYGSLRGCLQARTKQTLARSVGRVEGLTVDGGTATLVVVPKGGLYDGEKLDVVAVRDGDSWRIDELVADIPVGP